MAALVTHENGWTNGPEPTNGSIRERPPTRDRYPLSDRYSEKRDLAVELPPRPQGDGRRGCTEAESVCSLTAE